MLLKLIITDSIKIASDSVGQKKVKFFVLVVTSEEKTFEYIKRINFKV